ncbi:MAG: tetratricopeptide repeat protein [Chitinophagaceae bacterium]|nr:MAG: tetratricopeptide repeat protein [Chitinophagaceae bacterium]
MPFRSLFLFICLFYTHLLSAQPTLRAGMDRVEEGYSYLYRFKPIEAHKEFLAAIDIAKQLKDERLYAQGLFGAGQATWYTSSFHHAADTVKLALQHYTEKDRAAKVGALRILSNIYDDVGDYENAFKAVQQALEMNEAADKQNIMLSLIQMGKLYKNIGDYETAQSYYAKALAEDPPTGEYPFRELNHCLGELYTAKGNPDSANYFYRRAFIGNPVSKIIRLRIGESFLSQHQTDSAFFYLDSLFRETTRIGDLNISVGASIGMARVWQQKGDLPAAIALASQAYTIAEKNRIFKFRLEASAALASLYEEAGDIKKALYYYKLNAELKQAASSDVLKGNLFAFRQKTQQTEQATALRALEADKKLAQRSMLIVVLLALFLIVLLLLRHNNEKLRLKQRAAELEMQAHRAQMNPHFIFNCLSAINHFILDNEPDKASDYLTRFSRLMRMVLVNAGKESISLEEELDMLRLYLDMEQLRFKDSFDYSIDIDPAIQTSMISVPCFILQPFCENAIWHGLLHKEGKGNLRLQFTKEKEKLIIYIKDNGIGLEKASQLKTKATESMGQRLSAARLALFNNEKTPGSHFSIHDLKNEQGESAGTEVILKINLR